MAVSGGPRRSTTKTSHGWAMGYLKSSEIEVKDTKRVEARRIM